MDERDSDGERKKPLVLWTMSYQQRMSTATETQTPEEGMIVLPPLSSSLVFDDEALENVKTIWKMITGDDEANFLQFEPREGIDMNDED